MEKNTDYPEREKEFLLKNNNITITNDPYEENDLWEKRQDIVVELGELLMNYHINKVK